MPAYNFVLHDDLAPHLERHPTLFGLYNKESEGDNNWPRYAENKCPAYRQVPQVYLAKPLRRGSYAPSPPSSPEFPAIPRHGTFYMSSTSDDSLSSLGSSGLSSLDPEQDWFYKKFTPERSEVRRRNATSQRQGKERKSRVDSHGRRHVGQQQHQRRPLPAYNFRQIDELSFNLASLLKSCSIHVSAPSRAAAAAIPPSSLPERLSIPLTALHEHLCWKASDLLPSATAPQRHFNSSRRRGAKQSQLASPRITSSIPAPLRSHPTESSSDHMAGRFRAMQIMRRSLRNKSFLIPSLIALLTAKAVINHIQSVVTLVESTSQPLKPTYYSSPREIRSFGVSSKASEILGLGYVVTPERTSRIAKCYDGPLQQPLTPQSQESRRTSYSSKPSRPLSETVQNVAQPKSRWSPWSALSSRSSNSASTMQSSSRTTSYNSNHDPVMMQLSPDQLIVTRVAKLHELERQVEKLIRTFGYWIWGGNLRRQGLNADSGMWIVDREINKCRCLLVSEGFLK